MSDHEACEKERLELLQRLRDLKLELAAQQEEGRALRAKLGESLCSCGLTRKPHPCPMCGDGAPVGVALPAFRVVGNALVFDVALTQEQQAAAAALLCLVGPAFTEEEVRAAMEERAAEANRRLDEMNAARLSVPMDRVLRDEAPRHDAGTTNWGDSSGDHWSECPGCDTCDPENRKGRGTLTPEAINALPLLVRQYIHDLETRYDPAGEVRERWLLKEQNRALQVMVAGRDTGATHDQQAPTTPGEEKPVAPFKSFRADGWPLCPKCGEDELHCLASWPSLERPPLAWFLARIDGCYKCDWKPPAVKDDSGKPLLVCPKTGTACECDDPTRGTCERTCKHPPHSVATFDQCGLCGKVNPLADGAPRPDAGHVWRAVEPGETLEEGGICERCGVGATTGQFDPCIPPPPSPGGEDVGALLEAIDGIDSHVTLASPGLRHFVTSEETGEARRHLATLRAAVSSLAAANASLRAQLAAASPPPVASPKEREGTGTCPHCHRQIASPAERAAAEVPDNPRCWWPGHVAPAAPLPAPTPSPEGE